MELLCRVMEPLPEGIYGVVVMGPNLLGIFLLE